MSSINPFLATVEVALNRLLALDVEALDRISRLQGKVIGIEITGLGLTFYLLPAGDGVRVKSNYEKEADVLIRGAPFSLMHASLQDKRGIFSGDVVIDGDVQLGQEVQRILDRLDIDWEEGLSHVVGDVLAHQAGDFIRNSLDWLSEAANSFGRDSAEFVQEERRDLPSRYEVDEYLDGVDMIRDDIERLAARVARLEQKEGS